MNKIIGIFILSIFLFSCSSNLDFNQVNDLKLEPVIISNLATFDVPANQFVINGAEQSVFFDTETFDVFRDTFFNTSLVKTDLYFEIDNTINRAYTIDMYFLNGSNSNLYTVSFNIPAYTGVENLVTQTEIFENAKLDVLKKTRKIAFKVTMLPGPALTESSPGSLKLRSSATVYLVVQ
ncbi:MAG: hypothetical protein PHC28_17595 [Flavobacterium sp.]|uniref:hypothetical protein n=1 Tax=Flavobacterium sp. TaxID=239 RepID=UPI00262A37FF|nr:hypothetical protein [Flavobacterium sp.]MDD5152260.1 hypothetical protein [Flavobacterium sp.]